MLSSKFLSKHHSCFHYVRLGGTNEKSFHENGQLILVLVLLNVELNLIQNVL